jgi:hypothetical protein
MLKNILPLVLAALIAAHPVKAAEPPKQCQGDLLIGMALGALIMVMIDVALFRYYAPKIEDAIAKDQKKMEELEAKAKSCS